MSIDRRHVISTALGVLAGTVAAAGTLAVTTAGFALSYDAIRTVGQAAHMRHSWAWLLPVSVDGAMAVGTVTAVVMQRMGRTPLYPWMVVLAGAAVSIVCNALHAKMGGAAAMQLDEPGEHTVAMAVSAIPAVMLALSVHLLVVLIDAAARTLGQEDTEPDMVADIEAVAEASGVTGPPADPWVYSTPVADTAPDIQADSAPVIVATPTRTPARTVRRTATAGDVATRAARVLARKPDITQADLAAKLGVSERTLRRHLSVTTPATEPDTGPDTPPVNGHPVPDLITTT